MFHSYLYSYLCVLSAYDIVNTCVKITGLWCLPNFWGYLKLCAKESCAILSYSYNLTHIVSTWLPLNPITVSLYWSRFFFFLACICRLLCTCWKMGTFLGTGHQKTGLFLTKMQTFGLPIVYMTMKTKIQIDNTISKMMTFCFLHLFMSFYDYSMFWNP